MDPSLLLPIKYWLNIMIGRPSSLEYNLTLRVHSFQPNLNEITYGKHIFHGKHAMLNIHFLKICQKKHYENLESFTRMKTKKRDIRQTRMKKKYSEI